MRPQTAWRRGFRTLVRYPWLALLPLGWDVARMGLAYLGIPLGPVADAPRALTGGYRLLMGLDPALAPPSAQPAFRGFLPSFLPSVSDLGAALQPQWLFSAAGADGLPLLVGLLFLPLAEAFMLGLFLSLLTAAVSGRPPRLTEAMGRARQTLPALFVLALAPRLGVMVLPQAGAVIAYLVWWVLLALAPLGVATRGLPLGTALARAPGTLWGHFGAWFGLGWRTILATGFFHLVWSLAGRPLWAALGLYPFLATGLVAAAVALYLGLEEGELPVHGEARGHQGEPGDGEPRDGAPRDGAPVNRVGDRRWQVGQRAGGGAGYWPPPPWPRRWASGLGANGRDTRPPGKRPWPSP